MDLVEVFRVAGADALAVGIGQFEVLSALGITMAKVIAACGEPSSPSVTRRVVPPRALARIAAAVGGRRGVPAAGRPWGYGRCPCLCRRCRDRSVGRGARHSGPPGTGRVRAGARTPVIWFKVCPVLLAASAALLLAASFV